MIGLVVALFAAPLSWAVVNAQSDGLPAYIERGVSGNNKADKNGQSTKTGSTTHSDLRDAKANAGAKDTATAASDAAKAAAAGSPGAASATTGSKAAPAKPTPPAAPTPTPTPTGTHSNIITTIFWVGEPAGADNDNISNSESAWDGNWQTHYGGFDDPDSRNGYRPAAFTPKENPFYFALPYNDLDDNGHRKATAGSCPNAGASGVSWCKNSWIKITKGSKTTYAQWQDVGPLQEDDTAYVFGSAAPKNTWGAKAGLDVSPAVRDYLGLSDVDRTSWSFVSAGSVPGGPWKDVVTSSPGGW